MSVATVAAVDPDRHALVMPDCECGTCPPTWARRRGKSRRLSEPGQHGVAELARWNSNQRRSSPRQHPRILGSRFQIGGLVDWWTGGGQDRTSAIVSTAEDLTDAGAAATATDFPGLNAACTSLQTDVEAAQAYASVRCRAPQARLAAIKAAADYASELDVYVVHPRPSPASLTRYRRLGAEIVVVDPGRAVVEARCKAQRPWQMGIAVSAWYETATALYQQYRNVDTQGTATQGTAGMAHDVASPSTSRQW